jgi:hypothetical protein
VSPIAEVQIELSDLLYRRLAPQSHIKPDGSVASTAYKRSKKVPDSEPSVDLARLSTPEESIARAPKAGYRLGELQVCVIQPLGFAIKHAPLANNQSHCLIYGNTSTDTCAQLAENTRIIPDLVSS